MSKKKQKYIDTNKLFKNLVDFYNKKNWLHVEDFKEMVNDALVEVEQTNEEKQ